MTFLFLLSIINFLCLINIFIFLDLIILIISIFNLISILFPEEYIKYNKFTILTIQSVRKIFPYLPYTNTINFDRKNNIYYIDSKSFSMAIIKILFVLNSLIFIVISISLLPLFL